MERRNAENKLGRLVIVDDEAELMSAVRELLAARRATRRRDSRAAPRDLRNSKKPVFRIQAMHILIDHRSGEAATGIKRKDQGIRFESIRHLHA